MADLPPNFAVSIPGVLFRSGSPKGMAPFARGQFAARFGLQTVVTVAREEPTLSWWPASTLRLPALKPIFTRGMWADWKALLDDVNKQPILVHCAAGAERTGIYVAHAEIYRGSSLEHAMHRLKHYGGRWWKGPGSEDDLQRVRRSLHRLAETRDVLEDDELISWLRLHRSDFFHEMDPPPEEVGLDVWIGEGG